MSFKPLIITAGSLTLSSISAQAIDDIPYGIEALATYRSEYTFRGFQLAQDSTDLQLSTRYAFNKTTHLNIATWFTTETGDGDFTETGLLLDLRKDVGTVTYSLSSAYRSYSNSFFESGVSLEGSIIYHINDSFDLTSRLAYDTGAEGFYSDIEFGHYFRINDSSFINLSGGVSFVDSYYQRDGINDLFGKISYTYNVNQSISISPYLGTSVLLDNSHRGSDSLFGGINFAVSF